MRKNILIALTLLVALALPQVVFADAAADLYKAKCAGCHGGINGKAVKNLPKLASMKDPDAVNAIRNGIKDIKPPMPAFDTTKVDDTVINPLVAYVRTLK